MARRTARRLQLEEQLALVRWLENHRKEIEADRTPYTLVAKQASNDLKLDIGESTIRTTVKALGFTYKARVRRSPGARGSSKEEIAIIRTMVIHLASELGILFDVNFDAETGRAVITAVQDGASREIGRV